MDYSNDRIIAELLQGDEEYEFINMVHCGMAGNSPENVEIALALERALASDGSGIILYDRRGGSAPLYVPAQLEVDAPTQNSPCDVSNDEAIARAYQDVENEGRSEEEDCEYVWVPGSSADEDDEEVIQGIRDLSVLDEEANIQRAATPLPFWLRSGMLPVEDLQDEELEQCPICRERFTEGDELKQEICSHLFHPTCINEWRRQQETCPVCRAPI